jgi:hypothetical protein
MGPAATRGTARNVNAPVEIAGFDFSGTARYRAATRGTVRCLNATLERHTAANLPQHAAVCRSMPYGTARYRRPIDQWRRVFCFMNINFHVFTGCSSLTSVMKVVLHFVNSCTNQSRN